MERTFGEVQNSLIVNGEPAGTRTQDPRLKRAMLYQLSYRLTKRRARILPPTLGLCLARSIRRPLFGFCGVSWLVEQDQLDE